MYFYDVDVLKVPGYVGASVVLGTLRPLLLEVNTPCSVAIAGGAARDMLYGVTPKDFDIVVCTGGVLVGSESFGLLVKLSDALTKLCNCTTEIYQAYEQATCDFDERWSSAMCVSFANGTKVDVLVSSEARDIREAVDGFDLELNQCWVHQYSNRLASIASLHSVDVKETRWLKPVSQERRVRMQEKCTKLGKKLMPYPFGASDESACN